jgi:hypothetical protein
VNYCQELRLAGHVQGVRESHGADIVDVHTHVCVHDDLMGEEAAAAPKEMTGRKGESSFIFLSPFFR